MKKDQQSSRYFDATDGRAKPDHIQHYYCSRTLTPVCMQIRYARENRRVSHQHDTAVSPHRLNYRNRPRKFYASSLKFSSVKEGMIT